MRNIPEQGGAHVDVAELRLIGMMPQVKMPEASSWPSITRYTLESVRNFHCLQATIWVLLKFCESAQVYILKNDSCQNLLCWKPHSYRQREGWHF